MVIAENSQIFVKYGLHLLKTVLTNPFLSIKLQYVEFKEYIALTYTRFVDNTYSKFFDNGLVIFEKQSVLFPHVSKISLSFTDNTFPTVFYHYILQIFRAHKCN